MGNPTFRAWTMAAMAAFAAGWAVPAGAAVVRLHGATTVIDRVVNPHRYAVEKSTNLTLDVVGNATGKGMVDLAEKRCDAALVSEPMEIALKAAAAAGGNLDPAKLEFHLISTDEIVFVVHPSNPVKRLTWEQLRDIHTGRIKNWKEVGGKDAPIVVYSDTPTGGTRAMVKATVMGGQEYAPQVQAQVAVRKVAEAVAVDPNGIGGVGIGFVGPKTRVLETKTLDRPLAFVTLGPPTPMVRAVIDAYRAEARKH